MIRIKIENTDNLETQITELKIKTFQNKALCSHDKGYRCHNKGQCCHDIGQCRRDNTLSVHHIALSRHDKGYNRHDKGYNRRNKGYYRHDNDLSDDRNSLSKSHSILYNHLIINQIKKFELKKWKGTSKKAYAKCNALKFYENTSANS